MTAQEAYDRYNVMPSLQIHMRRVAAVAQMIINHSTFVLKDRALLTACFLHDVGKIVEFKLGLIPGTVEDKGLDYWKRVQRSIIRKYGSGTSATENILIDLHVAPEAMSIVNNIGFAKAHFVYDSGNFNWMVACYADQRVTPAGITTLETRMVEGRTHFKENNKITRDDTLAWNYLSEHMLRIQDVIFRHSDIRPEEITDYSVAPYIDKMSNFELELTEQPTKKKVNARLEPK